MKREDKERFVTEFKERIKESEGIIFTNFRGVDSDSLTRLRMELTDQNITHRVVKNTLGRLIFEEEEYSEYALKNFETGMNSITLVEDDPFTPARIIRDFIKETETMEIKDFILSGKALSTEEIKGLSDVSSTEEIYTRCVYSLIYPVQSLHSTLSAILREFVTVLNEVAKEREKNEN